MLYMYLFKFIKIRYISMIRPFKYEIFTHYLLHCIYYSWWKKNGIMVVLHMKICWRNGGINLRKRVWDLWSEEKFAESHVGVSAITFSTWLSVCLRRMQRPWWSCEDDWWRCNGLVVLKINYENISHRLYI